MFGWFTKQPKGLSQEQVQTLIDTAVERLQERLLTSTPEDHQQNKQLQDLMTENQRLTTEVRQLKEEYEKLGDEVQMQISQAQVAPQLTNQVQALSQSLRTLDSLPEQVQNLGQTIRTLTTQNDQLYRFRDNLNGQLEFTQQGLTRLEGQVQDYQQEAQTQLTQLQSHVIAQIAQVHNEMPDPDQITALVDQLTGLQGEFLRWQRTYTQDLDGLKQAILQLQLAPPPVMVAPAHVEKAGVYEDHFNAGKILLLSGDSRQALQSFTLALEVNRQSADAWYYLAVAQSQEIMVDQALDSLEQALQLSPVKRTLAVTGEDFPGLVGNERYERLVGLTPKGTVQEEDILLPQVDLANLFDL